MNVSALLKSAAVASAAFVALATTAQAQLPVRTQNLDLLGSTSGALRMNTGATVTNYTITWPSVTLGTNTGDAGYLRGTRNAGGNVDLNWEVITGSLVDGTGAAGQVAYFTDGNTLASSPNFSFAGSTVTIGSTGNGGTLGVNNGTNTASINYTGADNDAAYTIPDVGAGGGTFTVATGQGTAGQVLLSGGPGAPAVWTNYTAANLVFGRATGNNTYTQTINVTNLPATATVVVSPMSTDANIIQVTAVAAGSFTVQSTAPLSGDISYFANW